MKYLPLFLLLSACSAPLSSPEDPEVQAQEQALLGAPSGCKAPSGNTPRACDTSDTTLGSSSGPVKKRCSDSTTHPYYTAESSVNALTESGRHKSVATYRQYSGYCTHARSVAVIYCRNSSGADRQYRKDEGFRWYTPGQRTDYATRCSTGETFVKAVNEVDIDLWTAF